MQAANGQRRRSRSSRHAGQLEADSDGGSSPLVPILIAIAVLAAISIGVVLYRQRRQGDPALRVSSPKAS